MSVSRLGSRLTFFDRGHNTIEEALKALREGDCVDDGVGVETNVRERRDR